MAEPKGKQTTSSARRRPHVQFPSLPPTSSLTTLHDDAFEDLQENEEEEEPDTREETEHTDQQSSAPKPLAIKPVYKKRIVMSSAPDGIIRRSGSQAAMEKHMVEKQRHIRQGRSRISVYDYHDDLSIPMPVQEPPESPKSPDKPKEPIVSKPRPKRKQKPNPTIWRPKRKDVESIHHITATTTTTSSSSPPSSVKDTYPTFDREAFVELLVRYQTIHKERIAQLTTRPLPLQDLQTLIQAELEHEELALQELAIRLHREYLKLQLEEGVLMNMLHLSNSGVLDITDLERVKPPRKLRIQRRTLNKTKTRTKTKARVQEASVESSAPPTTSVVTSTVGSPMETSYPELMDVRMEEGYAARQSEEEKEDGEEGEEGEEGEGRNVDGEDEDEEGNRDDDESDVEGYDEEGGQENQDMKSSRPIYQLPGESYSIPTTDLSGSSHVGDAVGRPGASVRSVYRSADGLMKQVSLRKSQQVSLETGDQSEQELVDEDDEEDLFGSEAEDSEDGDPYSEEESGSEGDEDDQEDAAARVALRRMLAEFGAP
ncbi:hypothetical protein BGZ65_000483 [Modicella reniformis]|uniref:Uncharacterized protein n=1 Tax=Modicella reniformis TaxID=1440133 RepID=A0A9P6SNA2_9FUNG|nr:hypothetical protein BGZ65_000483 [Modicella reniformis]